MPVAFRPWWLAICLCFNAIVTWAEPGLIPASNPNFLYTGRIDFSDRNAPSLSWPGSSVKANFNGPYLEIVLDDQLGQNFFSIIVDGEDTHPHVIMARKGEQSYLVSDALGDGAHTVEIYKRTEGENGRTAFKGIKVAENASLLGVPKRSERRMEIYGDSVSVGLGNEAADDDSDFLMSHKNNYWAYGSIAARQLNAELHTIAQSGIGIMISWIPFTMPAFYDQLDAVGDNDSRWNFSDWTPDLVLINLLQNDSWLIDRDKKLQPQPSDAERVKAYVDFVKDIRKKYPTAQIICTLGSMDATANEKWPNYIREAVKQMRQEGDLKIDTLFFEFNGYEKHPRVAQHKQNAKRLVGFVREKMGW